MTSFGHRFHPRPRRTITGLGVHRNGKQRCRQQPSNNKNTNTPRREHRPIHAPDDRRPSTTPPGRNQPRWRSKHPKPQGMFTPFNAQVPCIVVEPGHSVRLLTDQRSEPTCAPCSAIAQFFFLPAPPANATPPTRYSPTSPPKSPSHPARNEDHDNHAGPDVPLPVLAAGRAPSRFGTSNTDFPSDVSRRLDHQTPISMNTKHRNGFRYPLSTRSRQIGAENQRDSVTVQGTGCAATASTM